MSKASHQAVNCPHCNSMKTKVISTYYTIHDEIVRRRTCKECCFKFDTIASKEEILDPKLFKVMIPAKSTLDYPKKIVNLKRLT